MSANQPDSVSPEVAVYCLQTRYFRFDCVLSRHRTFYKDCVELVYIHDPLEKTLWSLDLPNLCTQNTLKTESTPNASFFSDCTLSSLSMFC